MNPLEADSLAIALARRYCANGEMRRLREELRLSVREVARAVGVNEATVSRWERALVEPRGERAVRLGHALGVWLQSREADR